MTETLMRQAAQKIRQISDLPWVDANEKWGAEGTTHSNIRFIYEKERRTARSGKTYTMGGLKHWKWDLEQALIHFGKAFAGKSDSIDRMLRGKQGYWKNFGTQMYMAWYYVRSNELEAPDGMVTGTTLHGVWIEEAWHAALWSPVVALAVADWLETADENEDRALRVAKLIMDAPVFFQSGADDED